MMRNAASVFHSRRYIGYTLTFAFASNAVGLVAMNAVNARIVGRFGQRRLLHLGVSLLVVFSTLLVTAAAPVPLTRQPRVSA